MKNSTLNILSLFLIITLSLIVAKAQKLTAEEVIDRHLKSIADAEKLAAVRNQFILADLQFIVKGSTSQAIGKAVVLSEGDKNLWGLNLNANDYPLDKFAFDGKNIKVGYIRPGVRSILGDFILSNGELLKDGLLGGTLSSSWALLRTDSRKAKISYDGTKKINGEQAHVLSYMPKGGSDLTIKMYFDAKNFRHLRTEYTRVISARPGQTVDTSAGQTADYYQLSESFSNFRNINGITIPKTYKIFYSYTGSSGRGSREMEWSFNITNFTLNQELAPNSFNIEAK